MRKLILTVSLLLSSIAAFTFPVSCGALVEPQDIQMRKLMQARNVQQMEDVTRTIDEILASQVACQIELKSSTVPVSCFEVLKWEKREKILSAAQVSETWRWLEDFCISRARTLRTSAKVRIVVGALAVPRSCRNILIRRLQELEYIETERSPDRVFDRRHYLSSSSDHRPTVPRPARINQGKLIQP